MADNTQLSVQEYINLNYLHPNDMPLFNEAKGLADHLACYIGKYINVFEPKRRPLSLTALGLCDHKKKIISIMFREKHRACDRGGWKNEDVYIQSKKQVFKTVAHEVAHLMHNNHSKEFRSLEKELIEIVMSNYMEAK